MENIPNYDVEALRKNVEQCDANIRTYEGIIDDEIARRTELRRLIQLCEERDLSNDGKN